MVKVPDEILLVAALVLVATLASMVRCLLPYDPGDDYYHDLGGD